MSNIPSDFREWSQEVFKVVKTVRDTVDRVEDKVENLYTALYVGNGEKPAIPRIGALETAVKLIKENQEEEKANRKLWKTVMPSIVTGLVVGLTMLTIQALMN